MKAKADKCHLVVTDNYEVSFFILINLKLKAVKKNYYVYQLT